MAYFLHLITLPYLPPSLRGTPCRWIGVRLDAVAATALLAATLLAMAMKDNVSQAVG